MSGLAKSLAHLTAVRQVPGSILEGASWADSFLRYSNENYSLDLCYTSNEESQEQNFIKKYLCCQLVAPACYGSSLGSNPDISQKYKMGDISKGVANTL
jgi:hypothetical protein